MGYDVVIIGSGIGGLTAGAYLARDGVRPLVLEQHSQPGGYFTSFRRKGYLFDGGIQACEDGGMFLPMLKQLGVYETVAPIRSRFGIAMPDRFCKLEEIDDLENFYDGLMAAFPHERSGLQKIKRDAFDFCYLMRSMWKSPNPIFQSWGQVLRTTPGWLLNYGRDMGHFKKFVDLFETPVDEYLARYVSDSNLINFIAQIGYRGCPASFSMPFVYCLMDYYYPSRGGMQAVSDALAGVIEAGGGAVRCNTLVDEIMVEGGRAVGVRTSDGEEIQARVVINNGDAKRTYLEMLPGTAVPEDFRRRIAESRPSESGFLTYLGVDIPPEELPLNGCQHVVVLPGYKTSGYENIRDNKGLYDQALMMMSVPSLHDPTMAPLKKSVMVLQSVAVADYLNDWGLGKNGSRTKTYARNKDAVSKKMIAHAEKLIPGLSEKIEVCFTATPHTCRRYTLNSEGATVGWSYHPRDTFIAGMKGFAGAGMFTPVKNLYQVGHWALYPGGAPSGIMSGRIVSMLVRNRLRFGRV